MSKTLVEAIQIKGDNIKDIDGVKLSKGWTPSGNFHDRFHDEPQEPTPYVIGPFGTKIFIRNMDGFFLVRYIKLDDVDYFDVISELEFIKEFEEIKII